MFYYDINVNKRIWFYIVKKKIKICIDCNEYFFNLDVKFKL